MGDNDTSLTNDDDIKRKRRKRQKNIPLSPDGTGRGPLPGELMFNSDLANVLKSLGKHGAMDGFYRSWVGVSIANSIANAGGVMTYDDISNQSYSECTFPNPISVSYRGLKLWQAPPNGQGIAGLIALEGLKVLEARGGRYGDDDNNTFDNNNDGTDNINNNDNKPYGKARKDGKGWESANTLHSMIEMMRLGFADARSYVCDPDHPNANKSGKEHLSDYLLNPKRIADRVDAIFRQDQSISNETIEKYGMIPSDAPSGTVSFQVVDADGNAVSFVQSNFMGFGTGIVPEGCGFTMQNRGAGFSLDSKDHPNRPTPGKRPFHTILPGMLTHDDDEGGLYASISNMGGFMQPQGHLQLTVAMATAKLNPQAAIDIPRFCIADGTHGGKIFLEEGTAEDIVDNLAAMGHNVVMHDDDNSCENNKEQCDDNEKGESSNERNRGKNRRTRNILKGYDRSLFGKAQIVKRDRKSGVLWGGSDGRADGCAMGY